MQDDKGFPKKSLQTNEAVFHSVSQRCALSAFQRYLHEFQIDNKLMTQSH